MKPEIKQHIEQIRRGEVSDEYVKTPFGIVPKEWTISRIDKICRLSSGSTPRRDNSDNFRGDILWITSGELKNKVISDTNEKINEAAARSSHLEMYDQGTVVIAIYGLEAEGVRGTASIIAKKSTISQACMAFTNFKNVYNEYFYYWYIKNGQIIGLRYAQGTKQQNLSSEIIGSFPFCFPKEEEQRRIAKILSIQDKIIELKEKLFVEKLHQKKYWVQRYLTGKQRLYGYNQKWKHIKLNTILRERQEKNILQNHRICSVAVQKGVVDQIEHLGRSYAAADTSNYGVVHKGDIVYTKSPTGDFPYGIIKQSQFDENVAVSPLYGIYQPINYELGYLLHTYFNYPINCSNYLLPIIQKGAKNTINISNETFISKYLYLPEDYKEQLALAKLFIDTDRELNLLQKDIELEKRKKKALMQLLLTGIVRV